MKNYKQKGFKKKEALVAAREEKRTAKRYKSKGYFLQARQEAQHARFFGELARRL